MPLYDYLCPRGHEFEWFVPIAERKGVKCPECGRRSKIQISSAPAAVLFHAGYYDNLDVTPVYCGTAQELRDACDKRGLTSVYLENSSFRTRETVQNTIKEIDDDAEHRARARQEG